VLALALADRYRLERELGQGGMATVYLSHDLRHERKVAIKVLRPELAAVIGAERFVREIRTVAALQHPHILGLIDSGEVQGTAYYVMPFVEGESLRDRLTREKQLPVVEAVRIAGEVGSALDYAHRHGVIHRDIKPENILLHDGQALVADFGISLAVSEAGGTRMTETGMSVGTPFYMSPEQAMGQREITARSDVYALGCVLYEMLLGEPPFTGPTAQAIVAKVMTEEPRPLVLRRRTIPPHLESAVLTALAKLPADRFENAKEFVQALATPAALRTTVVSAPSARKPARRLPALPVGLLAIGLGLGFAGARLSAPAVEAVHGYLGERLSGPRVALYPQVSPDGKTVAFAAMEGRQTQVGVLNAESGDWKILTHDSTRGLAQSFAWSPDGNRIYYERFSEVPRGVYSISPLGGDDRLVLPDAAAPIPLSDGSLLVWRYVRGDHPQLFRYWPESGKLDTLPAYSVRDDQGHLGGVLPGEREVAFIGGTGPYWTVDTLFSIDLTTGKTRVLSPTVGRAGIWSLAVAPDGQVLLVEIVGDEYRVVAIARDGSDRRTVLLTTTSVINRVSVARDGSMYLDQMTYPVELIRYQPRTGRLERTPVPASFRYAAFPLPDGRVLGVQRSGGRSRVVTVTADGDPTDFLDTRGNSSFPVARLGADRILLRVHDSAGSSLVAADIATGSVTARLHGFDYPSFAGAPDGKTVFFADSGAIWSMPIAGGERRRIGEGTTLALDPGGRYLVTQVIGTDGVHLMHLPLDGGVPHRIAVRSDLSLAAVGLAPNAVAPDGRILVEIVSRSSWFWPAAILDPKTGALAVVPPGLGYDMTLAGWDDQSRVVTGARALESSLWRFRPARSPDE
jgi:tRNA A-37 threonylcarbamoyl transferase component Bud32